MREATYSSDRVSTTTDSMPSAASRWDSSMPAGPAPMIATWVRTSAMVRASRLKTVRGKTTNDRGSSSGCTTSVLP